jgi:hypothetical protein
MHGRLVQSAASIVDGWSRHHGPQAIWHGPTLVVALASEDRPIAILVTPAYP